jgi:hypothetical protein
VAYYNHRHSGIDETNILQVVKAVEGETIPYFWLISTAVEQIFLKANFVEKNIFKGYEQFLSKAENIKNISNK